MDAKASPKVVKEPLDDKETSKLPILFQPITDKGDYPALVIYAYPSDVQVGIERQTEKGTAIDGGYYGYNFDTIIRAIDKYLFSYKLGNTQKRNLRCDEFLELLQEHQDLIDNFMRGEVKKCLSKH